MSQGLKDAMNRNPHLKAYVRTHHKKTGSLPTFLEELPGKVKTDEGVDLIYPVGEPIFIHIFGVPGESIDYINIEPTLTKTEEEKYDQIRLTILDKAANREFENFKGSMEELGSLVEGLYDEVVGSGKKGFFERLKSSNVRVTKEEREKIKYFIMRNIVQPAQWHS